MFAAIYFLLYDTRYLAGPKEIKEFAVSLKSNIIIS